MKRLVKTLQKKKSGTSLGSSAGAKFSLQSPIARVVAGQIGKGSPAYLLQTFADAAAKEAGVQNVRASISVLLDWSVLEVQCSLKALVFATVDP